MLSVLFDTATQSTSAAAAEAQKDMNLIQDWMNETGSWLLNMIPKLIGAILILFIGWWITKFIIKIIKKAMGKSSVDTAAITFVTSFVKCALYIVIIISALANLDVNVTSLITAIGAATVTVGLALQDTMANVASGVLIIINKPFKAGDFVEFEGISGTITKIEITNTFMNSIDNKEIIIPNKKITSGNLINYSSHDVRRVDLQFEISYDDDIIKAKKLIKEMIDKDNKLVHNQDNVIGVFSYNDSSITIDVKVWCKTEDYWEVYYEMVEKTKYLFDKNGITIPYNHLIIENDTKK